MDAKGLCELVEGSEGEVLLRPLDGADVSAVQAALCRKLLLRPSSLFTQAAHDGGNNVDGLAARHAAEDGRVMGIALQGIASIQLLDFSEEDWRWRGSRLTVGGSRFRI